MSIREVPGSSIKYMKLTPEERAMVLEMLATGKYGLTALPTEYEDADTKKLPEFLSLKPPVLAAKARK